jgi:hypothetical protein
MKWYGVMRKVVSEVLFCVRAHVGSKVIFLSLPSQSKTPQTRKLEIPTKM